MKLEGDKLFSQDLKLRNGLQFVNFQLSDLHIANLFVELKTEWSSNIPIERSSFVPEVIDYSPFSNTNHFTILTESNAQAIINHYSNDCYVIFWRKDNTYHLLAKKNSEIQQFSIFCRITAKNHRKYSEFNLQDERGNWLFEEGVQANYLPDFLYSARLHQLFPKQLHLSMVKALSRLSSNLTLEDYTIKEQVLNNPSLLWLQNLPRKTQEKAILYFIDIFIEGVDFSNIDSFIEKIFVGARLSYRIHYSPEKIEENLNKLRELSSDGNLTASLVLASILFSGLSELGEINYNPSIRWSFFTSYERPVLFRNLEEYKGIIDCCPNLNQEVRNLFLLQYYQQKGDKEGIANTLKKMNLHLLIKIKRTILSDQQFIRHIESGCLNLEQLKSKPSVLHELIALNRICLVDYLKAQLPKERFQVKNKKGENILHVLANYIAENRLCGSDFSLRSLSFICAESPHLLAEMDNEGKTGYDKIASAINNLGVYSENIRNKLNSLIAKYPPPSQELDNKSYRP